MVRLAIIGQRPSGGFTDAAVAPGDDDAHGGLRSSSADLFVCGFECPPRQRGGGEYVRTRSRSTLWRISLVLLRPNVSFGVRRLATSARSRMSSIVVVDTPRSRNSSNAAPRIRSRTSCLRTRGVGLTFAEAPLNRRGSERPGAWMRLVGRSSRTAAAAGLPRAAAVRDDGRKATGQRFWNSCLAEGLRRSAVVCGRTQVGGGRWTARRCRPWSRGICERKD